MTGTEDDKVFSVRLKQDLLEKIEAEAALENRNRNQEIIHLIKKGLDSINEDRSILKQHKNTSCPGSLLEQTKESAG